MHKKRLYLLIGICVAFVGAVLLLAIYAGQQQQQAREQADTPRVEYRGNLACLPHKNTSPDQPQTLECAVGLLAQNGDYYALKDIPEEQKYTEFSAELIVTGEVTPPTANEKYNIKGTIKISTMDEVPFNE